MVKGRLYGDDKKEKNTARWVVYHLLEKTTLMLAPFIPHITEEVHDLYLKRFTN
jgi:valyl-tRNA synthetase